MTALWVLIASVVVLGGGGMVYSRMLARHLGESADRPTPAVTRDDGVDYVPTPTPVVFAHHFASIAGAGPIVGPVIAIVYGWAPALLWVLFGGLLIGAVHDYVTTYIATREGGQSIATVARRLLGRDAFLAMTLFLIVMLALVCATFLNLSAAALSSTVEMARVGMSDPGIFRTAAGGREIIVGGIASMSVIVITACAPLLGWMYIKKKLSVWKCSLLALAICAVSIVVGLFFPLPLAQREDVFGLGITGQQLWIFALSAYVLIAAGVPVWIFLQSRDFINVHILYVGMAALVAVLIVAGVNGVEMSGADDVITLDTAAGEMQVRRTVEPVSVGLGQAARGPIWPMLFILIACGAVSGFHSLCAGGTTCKQLTSEKAARQIGYHGMLLESFLAVCIIAVCIVGINVPEYLADVHASLLTPGATSNPVLGFALAVGRTVHLTFGLPVVFGTVAGMFLLEGFLVTTLDTAIRLTRYLFEEIWRTMFGRYDVFAEPVAAEEPEQWRGGEPTPAGGEGLPAAPARADQEAPDAFPIATMGLKRRLLKFLRLYWVNSGLAVAITLGFALSGGAAMLWPMFATSNQVLAAMGLGLASVWMLRRGKSAWYFLLPAGVMLATTAAALIMLLRKFLDPATRSVPLAAANIAIMAITVYLIFAGVREIVRRRRPGDGGHGRQ